MRRIILENNLTPLLKNNSITDNLRSEVLFHTLVELSHNNNTKDIRDFFTENKINKLDMEKMNKWRSDNAIHLLKMPHKNIIMMTSNSHSKVLTSHDTIDMEGWGILLEQGYIPTNIETDQLLKSLARSSTKEIKKLQESKNNNLFRLIENSLTSISISCREDYDIFYQLKSRLTIN